MDDTSYGGLRGKTTRPNALGRPVAFEEFEGRFVWADYAAPWCTPCESQAQAIHRLESHRSDVVFVTVMTSIEGYGSPPTQETARQWAERFHLTADRVLAADLTSMTVPQHILFSPTGQTLYRHTGALSMNDIKQILIDRTRDWFSWRKSGTKVDWMQSQRMNRAMALGIRLSLAEFLPDSWIPDASWYIPELASLRADPHQV